MAYIYTITNKSNHKQYVGKTNRTVEQRWKEHLLEIDQERSKNRPLYRAMRKYGVDNFVIEELEEVDLSEAEEKEKYWIETLRTYKNGYNATLGGDGKTFLDYDLIFALFTEGLNIKQISEQLNCDTGSVSTVLTNQGITKKERQIRGREVICKPIAQLDKDTNEILKVFPSIADACRFLDKKGSGHISAVCQGNRKTAYGYKWKYLDSCHSHHMQA